MNIQPLIKKLTFSFVLFLFCQNTFAQSDFRVNPTNWWVGMKNPNLQILVYSKNIAQKNISISKFKGVKLKSIQNVENPNYVFLNLEISTKAKAGNLEIIIGNEKINYELKNRTNYIPKQITQSDFIYLLLPDRFSNGDPSNDKFADMADPNHNRENPWMRHGGDLQGVINHLDYFKEMGVTALWLNPIVENNQPLTDEGGQMRSAYHGYGFTDQYNVDKRLGGNEKYKELIDAAHEKGIKIIQDAVYNHVGKNHWILNDLPTKDWLNQWDVYTNTNYKDQPLIDPHASKYDKKRTLDGWFVPFLPDLNQKNEFVSNYLIQHALWTVEYFGIDSWRIDTYIYNDFEFMNRCNKALLDEYPNMLIFGESWVNSVPNQAYFTLNNINSDFKCNLPSTVDFQLYFALNAALNENYGWNEGVQKLYQVLAQDYLYQKPEDLVTFLDNHDLDRFLSVIGEDIDKYKMGIGWLMTLRGIPSMYYGTEILMKNFKNPSDAEVRKDFPGGWKEDKVNKFTTDGRTKEENEAFEYIKKIAVFRKNSDAIANGKFTQFLPFDDGVYAYFRYSDKQIILVISNTGKIAKTVSMKRFVEIIGNAQQAKDVISGNEINLKDLTIKPKQQLILEIKK